MRKHLLTAAVAAVLLFLLAPLAVSLIVSFNNEASMAFPPHEWGLRWYENFFGRRQFQEALRFSVGLALAAAGTSTVCGASLAVVMAQKRLGLRRVLEWVVPLPVFVPEVVTGLALLTLLSKLHMSMGFATLWIAHVIITLPYATYTSLVSMRAFDPDLADAARGLGAGYWRTLTGIVIPIIKPGIASGAIFAFLLSFDNLMISSFLLSPLKTTLPVEVSMYIRTKSDPTVAAIASLLMLSTAVGVVIINRLFGLEKLLKIQG